MFQVCEISLLPVQIKIKMVDMHANCWKEVFPLQGSHQLQMKVCDKDTHFLASEKPSRKSEKSLLLRNSFAPCSRY